MLSKIRELTAAAVILASGCHAPENTATPSFYFETQEIQVNSFREKLSDVTNPEAFEGIYITEGAREEDSIINIPRQVLIGRYVSKKWLDENQSFGSVKIYVTQVGEESIISSIQIGNKVINKNNKAHLGLDPELASRFVEISECYTNLQAEPEIITRLIDSWAEAINRAETQQITKK